MEYNDRLVLLMKQKEVKNKDLMQICNVTNGAISQWRSGLSKPKDLISLSRAFDMDPDELKMYLEDGVVSVKGLGRSSSHGSRSAFSAVKRQIERAERAKIEKELSGGCLVSENNVEYLANAQKVPVIDMVAAGDWSECVDPYPVGDAESWEICPVSHGENTFAVRINGESMEPRFKHGEIIFCDPSQQAHNGDYVIAKLSDENQATFKQLVIEDGKNMLKAANPNWPQRYIPINGNCHIVGKVIARVERF